MRKAGVAVIALWLAVSAIVRAEKNDPQLPVALAEVMEAGSFYKEYPYQINIRVKGHSPTGDFEGQFLRDALSDTQWRTRAEISGYSEIEVRNGDQKWRQAAIEYQPPVVEDLWTYLMYPPALPVLGRTLRTQRNTQLAANVECADYMSPFTGTVCIDTVARTLIQISREGVTATYSDFQPFRDKTVARHVSVDMRDGKHFEGTITLLDGRSLTPELFSPPQSSAMKKEPVCGFRKSSRPTYTPDPHTPPLERSKLVEGVVLLKAWIAADGTVEHVEVFRSMDSRYDEEAIRAVRQWKFKPAECDGVPIKSTSKIEVNFKLYR